MELWITLPMNKHFCSMKKIWKKIQEKYGKKLILEQDGATAHTCKINKHLLEKLFTKDGWIQNPPISPDLAYTIEDLWGL